MKIRKINENNKAQVLGLPMYLIIIMIVAVAVIAAVLFMIPQGSKMIDAQVEGGLISCEGDGRITGDNDQDIIISVFTKDSKASPISQATVKLTGAGVAFVDTTEDDGTITISANSLTAVLESNKEYDTIKLTIEAAGFESYENPNAIDVLRTKTI